MERLWRIRCCWIMHDTLWPCGAIASVVAVWQFGTMPESSGALCTVHRAVYDRLEAEGRGVIVTEPVN